MHGPAARRSAGTCRTRIVATRRTGAWSVSGTTTAGPRRTGTAIKNGTSPLQTSPTRTARSTARTRLRTRVGRLRIVGRRRRRRTWRHRWWRGVHRARPSLRHDDAPRRNDRRDRLRSSLRDRSSRDGRWRLWDGHNWRSSGHYRRCSHGRARRYRGNALSAGKNAGRSGRNRRPADHRPCGRLGRNGRCRRRMNDIRGLTRQRHNAARRRSSDDHGLRRLDGRCWRNGCGWRRRRCHRARGYGRHRGGYWRRSRDHWPVHGRRCRHHRPLGRGWRSYGRWRRRPAGCLLVRLVLALLDSLQNIARLPHLGQIDLRSVIVAIIVACIGRGAATGALEVYSHTLGLIAFERAGVGLLLGYAHVVKDVENRPALHFELSC